MGARVEQQREERVEAPPPTVAAGAAPPAAVLRGRPLSASGVVALQRLVGNAAVVEMIATREEPRPPAPSAGQAPDAPPRASGPQPSAGLDLPASASAPAAPAPAPAAPAPAPPAPAAPAPAAPAPAAAASAAPAPAAASPAAAVDAASPAPAPSGSAAPGEAGEVRDPHADPGFAAMKGATQGTGKTAKAHQPAAEGAATAQGASVPPANDVPAQAAAAQVDDMSKQEAKPFDKKGFVEAVKKAIEAKAPKNLEEADDYKDSGKAEEVKDEVQGQVKGGKEDSEKDIKESKDATPDTSKAKPKDVKPMVNDEPGSKPKDVGAQKAMPGKRPPAQTDLSGGPKEINAKMAEAEVTDEQIEKSNEPEFKSALKTRDEVEKHAEKGPADYRAKEEGVLDKGRSDAEGAEAKELEGMHGARTKSLGKAVEKKGETKTADETKREKVASDIQGIYDTCKTDVTKILDDLDGKVDRAFSDGEKGAREEFERETDKKMSDYKADRYGGWNGGFLWAKDKLFDLPEEVNRFYEQGRAKYLQRMDGVISNVADVVGTELTAARARIAKGRADVQQYVAKLPSDLQEVGKEAEGKLESEFEQLSSDVDSKQDALVDAIAQKYVEARNALDERIKELQEANKGLVTKAVDAITGVIETIKKLVNMLLGVLARAAGVIGDIIKDPIGFLGNLIAGVKGGLDKFVGNIAGHLEQGLMGWLFGALGKAGLEMPKALDLPGIIDLVTQVLGLTYDNVRLRLAKIVGEPLVAKMEQTVDVIKTFATKGVAGAWEYLKDSVGDLKEMVVGEIKEFVTERVIKAGITWIAALLTPAGAFIKACKAIFDIVMFIVERGAEIMAFVNSVLDSISAVVKGNIGEMAGKIEDALAQALPLAISFLASLLGLGGIGDKVRGIVEKVKGPINKAIDKVVTGAVKTFKKAFKGPIAKYKKAKKWAKDKVDKGKAWAKDKVDRGKAWAKGKARRLAPRRPGRVGSRSGASDQEVQPTSTGATTSNVDAWPGRTAEETEAIRLTLLARNDAGRVTSNLAALGLDVDRASIEKVKQHLFNSSGIAFAEMNFRLWTRMAAGTGTIGDAQIFVHELREIDELGRSGFDFLGKRYPDLTANQKRQWQSDFGRLYGEAHAKALESEFEYLADEVHKATNRRGKRVSAAQMAAIDPLPLNSPRSKEASQYMIVGGGPLRDHAQFEAWRASAGDVVEVPTAARKRLGLPEKDDIRLGQLVDAVKRSRPG